MLERLRAMEAVSRTASSFRPTLVALARVERILARRGPEMKRSRFSEEQIVRVVEAVEGEMPVTEAVRPLGVSRASITIWRNKYAGLEVSDAKRLKAVMKVNFASGTTRWP